MTRKPGRPPLDPRSPLPSTEVSVSLAAKDYTRVKQLAGRERASVQDVIRRVIQRELSELGVRR